MKPDSLSIQTSLRKREAELQKIIRQMQIDNLQSSPVYKNLERELHSLKSQLKNSSARQG